MRYFRAFIYSLIFHIVAALVFWLLADKTEVPLSSQPTVVELMEAPELPRRPTQPAKDIAQMVRQANTPDKLKTAEKRDRRFLSEEEQSVLEERQARASGMTANRANQNGNLNATPKSISKNKALDIRPETLSRLAEQELVGGLGDVQSQAKREVQNTNRPLDFSKFGSVERGLSTMGDRLPDDIKFGDFTALNTDRHLYYSFYSRIEELIRSRWVNYAKAVVYNVENGTERVSSNASWTTKLEIVLDKKGIFKRAILHEGSGVRSLDSAPVQAFNDAQQFPNPPAEMVKEDGTIRIFYSFHVQMVPRYASHNADDSDSGSSGAE